MVAALALFLGCQTAEKKAAPPPGRFVAVAAKTQSAESLAGFCDVTPPDGAAAKLTLPEMDRGRPQESRGGYWINVWATWCKPCIEEMPMLIRWKSKLTKAGVPVTLDFVSADETVDIVDGFRKTHPAIPESMHLKDPEALESWMEQLGLDKGAGLPIHIFVRPDGRIRCVRAAAINEGHYSTVVELLRK